jgi:hypothetical protein
LNINKTCIKHAEQLETFLMIAILFIFLKPDSDFKLHKNWLSRTRITALAGRRADRPKERQRVSNNTFGNCKRQKRILKTGESIVIILNNVSEGHLVFFNL